MASSAAASAESVFRQAIVQHSQGRLDEAWLLFQQALRLRPHHFDTVFRLGVVALQTARPQEAVELFGEALSIDAQSAAAHLNQGYALAQLQQYEAAIASYDRAIALKADIAGAHFNRGIALHELRQLDAAVASYGRAIALQPDYQAYKQRGDALCELRKSALAIASYDRAIAMDPTAAEAYNNRGNALRDLQRHEAAIVSYDRAIGLRADFADAWFNRGCALCDLGRHEAAIESYDKSIALEPGSADAHCARAAALARLRRSEEALEGYARALALKPDFAEVHLAVGALLSGLGLHRIALASYDNAITAKPNYAQAHVSRGNALFELREYEEAIASFETALTLEPDTPGLLGACQHARMQICDWTDMDARVAQLDAAIDRNLASVSPFFLLALSDSPPRHRRAAELWAAQEAAGAAPLGVFGERGAGGRIRVGYYSADFREHPVSVLLAGVIEAHDRDGFEVVGLSFGGERGDALRERLRGAFERFIEVGERSEGQIAQLSRGLGIDIAVDLGGYTHASRPRIFALRAAPVQVNYLGYPGTLGARYMDYVIADRMIIPAGGEGDYEEKIIYLPDSYQPNDGRRVIGERRYSREECGLPGVGFVYCCFNHSYKITPGVFAGWMRILRAVPGSVLWLSQGTECSQRNLRSQAQGQGVSGERLVFAPRLAELSEHLARHRVADLFLDTLPFNAHTTASDALWAGVPVLTRLGQGFAGRVAGSVLRAVGLDELISETQLQYEERAVQLAREPQRLAQLRARLASNRGSAPLFDTQRYTRHLEAAYVRIHERHRAGLPPAHLEVQGLPHAATPGSGLAPLG